MSLQVQAFQALCIFATVWLALDKSDSVDDVVDTLHSIDKLTWKLFKNITQQRQIPLTHLKRLSSLATKLKTLQSKYDPLADSSERRQPDIIQNFQTWCTQNNVTFEGLEIRHTTTMGRGIFAVNDLEPDSEVINVPKRAMLSLIESKSFFADTELIPEEIIELLKMPLTLRLIVERLNESSEWQPYVTFFPIQFPSLPLAADPLDFIYLEGSSTFYILLEEYCRVLTVYSTLFRRMIANEEKFASFGLNAKSLTFNIFFWAFANANTRSFHLAKNNDLVLVPYWDTCNYGRFPNVDTWVYDDNIVMKSVEKIAAGRELLATYNSKSTVHNFFINWGIHCSGYSMGPYFVHFHSLRACSNARVWKRYQLALPSSWQIMIVMNDDLPLRDIDLMYLLLVFGTMNEGQWPENPLGAEQWKHAVEAFQAMINNALNKYNRTIVDHEAALIEGNIHFRTARLFALQAICEQRNLVNAYDKCNRLLKQDRQWIEQVGARLYQNFAGIMQVIAGESMKIDDKQRLVVTC